MTVLHPQGLVLDAGALREAESNPRGMVWALCRRENQAGRQPLLPSVVLAQIWRGGARQAAVASVVKATRIIDVDELMARRVGKLLGVSGTADVVDAVVAIVAMDASAAVITSDPVDIGKLVESVRGDVPLITV
ncbi:hypothetical protein [Nocardiopsis sp. JB363]|uniref:hypothetical protein n=1 Tax=Nocardiopsis sp. JB363 TaxID=1434837 RepID=UPI000B34C7A8|nr:hypothetical protein [Nocardiopsis sp. JB363]